jgi:hypothetical protein
MAGKPLLLPMIEQEQGERVKELLDWFLKNSKTDHISPRARVGARNHPLSLMSQKNARANCR